MSINYNNEFDNLDFIQSRLSQISGVSVLNITSSVSSSRYLLVGLSGSNFLFEIIDSNSKVSYISDEAQFKHFWCGNYFTISSFNDAFNILFPF